MAEIKIKCPTCGKILRLADAPNINQATFTCPVCKDKHIVGQCQRIAIPPIGNSGEETRIGGYSSSSAGEETRIAGGGDETRIGSAPQQQEVGQLIDNYGKFYRLSMGTNTIGRKASSSTAMIQIDTSDRYMSRSHVVIEVRNMDGQIVHLLKNGANKNPSYLNGILIGASDQLILNNGDRLLLGKTELTFKK